MTTVNPATFVRSFFAIKMSDSISPTVNDQLKVIVVAFARSGTASLSHALRQLGYNEVFHGVTLYPRISFTQLNNWYKWLIVATKKLDNKEYVNFDDFFVSNNICVAMDTPLSQYWRQLYKYYPNCKIILNIRDYDKWYPSWKFINMTIVRSKLFYILGMFDNTFYTFYHYWCPQDVNVLTQHISDADKIKYNYNCDHNDLDSAYVIFDDKKFDDKKRRNIYNKCINSLEKEIIEFITNKHGNEDDFKLENHFLKYNAINQGWKPLCKFLKKSVPIDIPFPVSNNGKSFTKFIKDATIHHFKLNILLGFVIIIIAIVVFCLQLY